MTVPELRAMIRMYEVEQVGLQTVAARLGRSISTVHRHLRVAGVVLRPVGATSVRRHPRRLPERELRRTVELYRQGLTQQEVADAFGISVRAVRYRLSRAGEPLRARSEAQLRSPRVRRIDLAVEVEIARLYVDEMLTISEIAVRVGVARETVRRAMRRQGVSSRDRAQAARVARGLPAGEPMTRVLRATTPPSAAVPVDERSVWGRSPARLPVEPLIRLVDSEAERMGGIGVFAEQAGLSVRTFWAWRSGERRWATWDAADATLIAANRFWWEVFDPAGAAPKPLIKVRRSRRAQAWMRGERSPRALRASSGVFSHDRRRDIDGWIEAAQAAAELWGDDDAPVAARGMQVADGGHARHGVDDAMARSQASAERWRVRQMVACDA